MVPVLLRPFPQLHHFLPNKMLQRPKHSFRRSVNQALGIFQKPNDMYVCMYKPTAPCKKLSASPKKPSDSGKKTSSLWWSWPKNAIKSKNHSEGGQHFKDAILSSAHVNYIQNSCFFLLWYNFEANILKWTLGVGCPENEAWYARCSVTPKPGDGLRLWPMQAGSGTWPSPCGQVYVNSGSFWNHKDLWFVPHFSEPVISLNYEINSLCGGTYSGWCRSSPEEAGHDVTAWFHSASSLWNLVILLAKIH